MFDKMFTIQKGDIVKNNNKLYYVEKTNNGSQFFGIKVDDVICSESSELNDRILILQSSELGRFLVLDTIQFAEVDEYRYHEPLVHPAMLLHPNPKKVFILGGGDGCAAREVLKHDVDEIFLVDIDKKVVDLSKRYFSDINKGALEDKKVNIVIDDVRHFIEEYKGTFDVAIMDLPDISVSTEFLYTSKQILHYKRVLSDNSILVSHAQMFTPPNKAPFFPVYYALKKAFKHVALYKGFNVPSFCDTWYFVVASDNIPVEAFRFREPGSLFNTTRAYSKTNFPDALKVPRDVMDVLIRAEAEADKKGFAMRIGNLRFDQNVSESFFMGIDV